MSVSESVPRGASTRLPTSRREPSEAALGDLVAAIMRRKIEPICVAYTAFRREVGRRKLKEILRRLDRSVGRTGLALVAMAFSRRRCYMCSHGVNPCGPCGQSGRDEGGPCLQCDGLGVEPCEFCMGSGLADIESVPEEFRQQAGEQRLDRLEKEVPKLNRLPRPGSMHQAEVSAEVRSELAGWLIRLRGRLRAPTGIESDNGQARAERLAIAAQQADALLEALRPDDPPAEAEDG